MSTDNDPTNFVRLTISRDRQIKSIANIPHSYVATLIDRFFITTSSAKYSMSEDYLTGMTLYTDVILQTPYLQTLFQEKMGSILYFSSQIHPDLLYSTTQLFRRSNKTTARDMSAVDHLLHFIASTASLGITFCTKICLSIYKLL